MIPLPSKLKIVQESDTLGIFELEGLYPGYGVTLGNSLRRVLLSSIEGAAITTVKIKGVSHEFSTIDGVLEDVVSILLNLKRVRFRLEGDEPQTAVLEAKGEKEVKAKEFKLPPFLKIANPEQKILTITDPKVSIEIEVKVEKGVGYEPVERRKKDKAVIGEMHLDAIYSPVKRVAFKVENMRVGERTDFDRLILEVETDGTKTPSEVLREGVKILQAQLSTLYSSLEETETKGKEDDKTTEHDQGKVKIDDLDISEKIKDILKENKIKTVAGLKRKSREDLLALKGLGEKAVAEIEGALSKLGVTLKQT